MKTSSQPSPDSTPELSSNSLTDSTSELPPPGPLEIEPKEAGNAGDWADARVDLEVLDDEPTVFDTKIVGADDAASVLDARETAQNASVVAAPTVIEGGAPGALDAPHEGANLPSDEDIYAAGYVEPRGSRWPAIIIFLLLIGGIGIGAFYVKTKADAREARRWAPIEMPDRMAFVPTDWGAQTLGQKLQKSDKIRDVDAFAQAAKEIGLTNVTPGGYALPERAGPRDLARLFKAGPTHEKAVFPPGFTGLQIAARLQKEGFGGADGMEKLIYPAQGFSPYEGTLAPGTYWMPIRADGKTLIAQMQEEFAPMMKKLPQPFPTVNGKPLTKSEIVTIASLIERESNLKSEMPLVAGVMINRLQKPMRLQIDASVQYARIMADKEHKTRLYFKDYKFESPFNTYLNDGLPPTPICNPGLDALMAAARPAKTDALFYVYSPKLKKHIFASDFEGHKNNVAKARRERDALEAAN